MNKAQSITSGYVVSDMHIFGCSSLYTRYLPTFYSQVSSHSVTILNGDTFDFKRSIFKSSQETTRYALEWLRDLSRRASQSKIFFIVGNHDCQLIFLHALIQALPQLPNISLVTDSLRLGSSLFLHGDVVDLPRDTSDITQVRQRYDLVEPNLADRIFAQLVTHLGVNKIEYLRHPKHNLVERIVQHVRLTDPSGTEGLQDIYFGHTHVPFHNFQYAGIRFHNTGSMIRGLPWRPIEFSANQPS
jgi:UDP-2,3-diacylglucosamine pyrophosphatase LpxH